GPEDKKRAPAGPSQKQIVVEALVPSAYCVLSHSAFDTNAATTSSYVVKIARWFAATFFAISMLAADEFTERLQPALEAITPDGLLAHIKVLASDEFEGRAPGTKGEELSVNYIADQFRKIGLKPGSPDGSYTQEVPLAGIKSEPRMSFAVRDGTIDP